MLPPLLRALRPHQWVKNLFVIAPVVFAKELGDPGQRTRAALAFALFCATASAVYLWNDLSDVEADRAHPVKRHRPIASGAVSTGTARGLAAALLAAGVGGALLVSLPLAATIAGYVALNVAYTGFLKRIAYMDALCIALGFELRVLAGTTAVGVAPSAYLLAVTFLLAVFLSFGKRMHELRQDGAKKQRAVLERYQERPLRGLLYTTATLTVAVYATYTLDPHTVASFGTTLLPVTTIFTAFGVGRFLALVHRNDDADSPTEQMLRDAPFLANLVLWAITVVALIYVGNA